MSGPARLEELRVIRKRLGRLSTAITAAALLGAMAIAAPASAATPGWEFQTVQQLPDTVGVGQVAGFKFRIYNGGKSNISALFLTDTAIGSPEFNWNSRGTACETVPEFKCAFGALNSKAFIDVIVAYRVGSTNFTNKFQLDSTGDPAGGNNSHGDSKFTDLLTTIVSSDANFAGSFTLDTSTLANVGTLNSGNPQSTSIDPPETLIPVTIEDGITTGIACTHVKCAHAFGQWSKLNVDDNHNYGPTTAFKVTLMLLGSAVPGGVTASEIEVLHTTNAGSTYLINATCTPTTGTPTNAECKTVTKIGSNFRIVVWLFQNGAIRGTW
jgi:hypothetical protein